MMIGRLVFSLKFFNSTIRNTIKYFWAKILLLAAACAIFAISAYTIHQHYAELSIKKILILISVITLISIAAIFVYRISIRNNISWVKVFDKRRLPEAEVSLRKQFLDVIVLLRNLSGKRSGYIYKLPWYIVLGGNRVGKTTVLENSGLKFPVGHPAGASTIANTDDAQCRWWFAEEAILIDTPGEFAEVDNDNRTKNRFWTLLRLLRVNRPLQPLNGIILIFSLDEIRQGDTSSVRGKLNVIRQRLSEADVALGARVPVYIIINKIDLLVGFSEFFRNFNQLEREQIWGVTFPLSEHPPISLQETFCREFLDQQHEVNSMLLERLQKQPDIEMRGRIFKFSAELCDMRDKISNLISALSSGSQLVSPPLLRGIYFASSTQPLISPLTGNRSYFLLDLFRKHIFKEAPLVSFDKRLLRRRQLMKFALLAFASIYALCFLAVWIFTYVNTHEMVRKEGKAIETYSRATKDSSYLSVADTDFTKILPIIDPLRNLTSDAGGHSFSILLSGQSRNLDSANKIAYLHALNRYLLPRLILLAQRKIAVSTDANLTFDLLKFYGMLGGLRPISSAFIRDETEILFEELYPNDSQSSLRKSLLDHVDHLISGALIPITLDEALIRKARKAIEQESVASRALYMLINRRDSRRLPAWVPGEEIGPGGDQLFERKTKSLWRGGIAGIYTRRGFIEIVLPFLASAVQDAVDEQWVHGIANSQSLKVLDTDLINSVLLQYYDNFQKQWREILSDIQIRKPQNFNDASELARLLSTRPNALEGIGLSIAKHTDLSIDSSGVLPVSNSVGSAQTAAVSLGTPNFYDGLRVYVSQTKKDAASDEAGEQFKELTIILQALYGQLLKAATSSILVSHFFDADNPFNLANDRLTQEAKQLPSPLDHWITVFASDINDLVVNSGRASAQELWNSHNRELCDEIVSGRYPFVRNSPRDVSLSDFVRLFGPSGVLQTFFKEHVEPFVNTSTKPWRWRFLVNRGDLDGQALAQFENAEKIRAAFFSTGSNQPNIQINVEPVSLSNSANAVILEIDGAHVVYFHGPKQNRSFIWPAAERANLSRVAFQPGGWLRALSASGDWSPFRLFDQSVVELKDGNNFRMSFSNGVFRAEFDVQFGSVLNPFRLPALNDFSCPFKF
ncbi:type VI secretion system membrane subunit TssM [Ochrobactrum sp. GPK 3]|uniref:type VI secretion system membrane subunit TssM n=1 Tax=Brucella sp. 22210 TaxID=3453892 RepID=UPI00313851E6